MGQILGLLWRGDDPIVGQKNSSEDLMVFNHSELEACTNNFSVENFLGRGGFGSVYRGTINGERVAVKESRNADARTRIQWEAEKRYLPKAMHKNIINLIGYCETDKKLYLVYPFMPNGNVQSKLSELDWSRTLKILRGAAYAIQELHSHLPPLIYRDLKPDNLLLDKDFNPKLADFGTVTAEGKYFQYGTAGYTDPTVMHNGLGTKPNDIYSLGVVILQLIMKEKRVLVGGKELTTHITDWAKTTSPKGHVVDQKLLLGRKGCCEEAAQKITELALDCVRDPQLRPTIREVLQRLAILDGNHKKSQKIQP